MSRIKAERYRQGLDIVQWVDAKEVRDGLVKNQVPG